jgi:hypothetical protein
MAEQELNLLQLTSCRMAELCAGAPQVVRGNTDKAGLSRIQLDHVPHDVLREASTPPFACSADAPKYLSGVEISCLDPLIQGRFDPFGYRNGPNVPPLPTRSTMAQCSSRCCKCVNSRSASSRRRSPQPSKIARIARSRWPLALQSLCIRTLPKAARFVCGEPITEPHAQLLGAFDSPDAGCQLWAEQAGICRFIRQTADRRKSAIDRGRREATVLEENAKARDHYFVKGEPWLRTIPLNELIDGMSITALDSGERRLSSTAALLWSRSGRPSFDFGRFDVTDLRLARLLIPAASSAAGRKPSPSKDSRARFTST